MNVVLSIIVVIGVLAANSASVGVPGSVYSGCEQACRENAEDICAAAERAADEGRLDRSVAGEICECGILVCANTCVEESGQSAEARPPPQRCLDLGVY